MRILLFFFFFFSLWCLGPGGGGEGKGCFSGAFLEFVNSKKDNNAHTSGGRNCTCLRFSVCSSSFGETQTKILSDLRKKGLECVTTIVVMVVVVVVVPASSCLLWLRPMSFPARYLSLSLSLSPWNSCRTIFLLRGANVSSQVPLVESQAMGLLFREMVSARGGPFSLGRLITSESGKGQKRKKDRVKRYKP